MRRRAFSARLLVPAVGGAATAACGIRVVPAGGAPGSTYVPDDLVPRTDVATAFQAVSARQALLVDVRSGEAWRARHASGAVSLPLDDIEREPASALTALPADRRPILYCT